MKRQVKAILLVSIFGTVLVGWQAHAADPTTADCLDASESSLALRDRHKLRNARTQLLVCSAASCPGDIRDECIRRVAEINAGMPTIVFEVKDAAGNDLSAVKATMDGEPLAERLEGTALSIDPGDHTFTFDTAGQLRVQKKFVIREGEKDRRERILFGPPTAVTPDPVPTPHPIGIQSANTPQPTARGHLSTQKGLALATAGLGVVGLGLGIGFGIASLSKHGDAVQACSGPCANQHGVDLWNEARSAGDASTIGFIFGAAGLAGGAALWFTSKPESERSPNAQVGFGLGAIQLKGVW
jgi:hypothetical protein